MAKPQAVSSTPDFASVLDTPASEIERPKPLPRGTYHTIVQGQPRIDKSAKKGTEFSEFTLKILEPLDDVDEDELAAYGPVRDKTTRVTFYHTPNSVYRLKEFIEHCGIDTEKGSLRQLIAETPGCQVLANIVHEPSQDGGAVYANVKSTAAVE